MSRAGSGSASRSYSSRDPAAVAAAVPVLAPGDVDELVVDAGAQHLRVTVLEVAVALPERGDLRRADEREVLRPEEDDLPLAGVVVVRHLLELLALLETDGRLQLERRKL